MVIDLRQNVTDRNHITNDVLKGYLEKLFFCPTSSLRD